MASSAADYGEERVLTLVGSKQQTDLATDLIKEVINEVGPTLVYGYSCSHASYMSYSSMTVRLGYTNSIPLLVG